MRWILDNLIGVLPAGFAFSLAPHLGTRAMQCGCMLRRFWSTRHIVALFIKPTPLEIGERLAIFARLGRASSIPAGMPMPFRLSC